MAKNKAVWILCIFTLSIFASCTESPSQNQSTLSTDSPGNIAVYFCSQTNCGALYAAVINKSQISVDCALYTLKYKPLVNVVMQKQQQIPVRIVIDKSNEKGSIAGDFIKTIDSSGLMHNKFCVIDSAQVITGSYNPSTATGDDNNVVVISSHTVAQNYEAEFSELWSGVAARGNPTKNQKLTVTNIPLENYFCPDDGCTQETVSEIAPAKKVIYFMTYRFTSEPIADALLLLEDVEIKGVFEKQQAGSQYSQYRRLKDFGLDVRLDTNPSLMHHKVFVIDNETVITGSFNPTQSADSRNDENMLIIHDRGIAQKYAMEFFRIYGQSK